MTKNLYLLILTFLPLGVFAQVEKDSTKAAIKKSIQKEFSKTRIFNLEYDQTFSRSFDSELDEGNFTEGKIAKQQSIDFAANVPIYSKGKWNLSGSGRYNYYHFEFEDVENISNYPHTPYEKLDFHHYGLSLNSTYFSMLFKKPVIYNASVLIDGSENGLERVKGIIGASLILKRTENTTITLGLIGIIDPASQIPFAPVFSYFHKFKNSEWEFDFIMPQRILFRRPFTEKGRLSVGTTFGADAFYFDKNLSFLPHTYSYSQLKIDGGLIYEHRLSHQLIVTFKAGARKYISNRMTKKDQSNKNYIYKNHQGMTGYFNIGISYNPF